MQAPGRAMPRVESPNTNGSFRVHRPPPSPSTAQQPASRLASPLNSTGRRAPDPAALAAYMDAARSRSPNPGALAHFLDPKPRGATLRAESHAHEQIAAPSGFMSAGGWNYSTGLDWVQLNGSREIRLVTTETALRHPESDGAAQTLARLYAEFDRSAPDSRTTDRRTGHRLDFPLPQQARFTMNAAYARLIDQRRGEEGRAPEKRAPAPRLWYGSVEECAPANAQEKEVVEQMKAARQARAEAFNDRTRRRWGMSEDPSIANPAEYSSTQRKKAAISSCPSAAEDTYNRLFHLDAPPPVPGTFVAPRSEAQKARSQQLLDRASHGRAYDVVSNARIPVSEQAQMQYALSGKNAVARHLQDQRAAAQQQQQQQQQQQPLASVADGASA